MLTNNEGVIDLVAIGQEHLRNVHRNLTTPRLYEEIIKNREGQIAHMGPVVVRTSHSTKRSHADRFIVAESDTEDKMCWSDRNNPISEQQFKNLYYRLMAYMQNKEAYVQYCHACNDPEHRVSIRFVTETAWHSLFVRNMFEPLRDTETLRLLNDSHTTDQFKPEFSVVHIPGFQAVPEQDGTRSSAFVVIHLGQRLAVIGGTSYAGEIKQAVFTMLNYLFPTESVLPMRCSANMGQDGDVAIFIGRSGTGKTTLSVDPERRLVGDNRHGWSDKGIFSFERGCYAKVMNISSEDEPEIYDCTRKFGTILENVSVDLNTRNIDLDDERLTKNTRAAYPMTHVPNAICGKNCGHPRHLFLLTCDAFGVIPPIARLTPEQAIYGFLSNYTAQFSPTEADVEPQAGFNVCFGASSFTLQPSVYAKLFMEKIKKHNLTCWIMNTGWNGEPYDRGERIKIAHSRALLRAAVSGSLEDMEYETDPVFLFEIPKKCPGVPDEMLNPRNVASDEGEYEVRANRLAREFMKDFSKFENEMPENMRTLLSEILSLDGSFDLFDEFSFSM
ncbi:MAG: phosphoenolpyruvate carboxykinase (ATP) [Desulfobacteraceae bacterium]|nr:phosphoenolpyruvate carboxykinase (ATP) [Desulfobacteraceae bacterium]